MSVSVPKLIIPSAVEAGTRLGYDVDPAMAETCNLFQTVAFVATSTVCTWKKKKKKAAKKQN